MCIRDRFRDVPKTSWYYNTVKYTYENNLISGANEYEFRPDAKITRGKMCIRDRKNRRRMLCLSHKIILID